MPWMVQALQHAGAGVEAAVRGVIESPRGRLTDALVQYAHDPHTLVPVATVQAQPAIVSSTSHTSFVQDVQTWAYNWSPVVTIVFFSALIFLMWRTLKVM